MGIYLGSPSGWPFFKDLGTGSLFGGDPGRFQERSRKVRKRREGSQKWVCYQASYHHSESWKPVWNTNLRYAAYGVRGREHLYLLKSIRDLVLILSARNPWAFAAWFEKEWAHRASEHLQTESRMLAVGSSTSGHGNVTARRLQTGHGQATRVRHPQRKTEDPNQESLRAFLHNVKTKYNV